MATPSDVRRIALSLPETEEVVAFTVKSKGTRKPFAWVRMERIDAKKALVPHPAVLAVRVANVTHRDLMIAAEPAKFFIAPHYAGYPAVLVRLAEVSVAELRTLLTEASRCQAPATAPKRRKKS